MKDHISVVKAFNLPIHKTWQELDDDEKRLVVRTMEKCKATSVNGTAGWYFNLRQMYMWKVNG